ncbi:biotin--[acetyl-CoA-carboxylase] ligase [Kushneria marisflavi]|uniref:Bifunctional ligase/repressor BirA n=1 Tax=Kushneria marisflavi TaxID=157779 RepID=A0A240URD5_9GAMM|nr:biotin--[acetyl-CoA-carboxylase] ligase [Kushneria marisflavi]ART63589.1 biotin--[acetyl-CoA-carboxylase] ligase [Kushneria marisflavi]RKD85252.1 BirA family biotin operon repressor/biotin-[acetyl-CoA-carboxylase] ligase [Kushneria marisflavi]
MSVSDLIRLMSDGAFHSGEALGKEIGVSRTAVWKQLRKLEGLGLSVETARGCGYRLLDPPEPLRGGDIVANLSRTARQHLRHLFVEDSIGSTNTFLLERFAQGAGHAEVCLAEWQSAGRGRRGRSFYSEWGGNIHFSIGWQFESGVGALEGLSLAVGVIMADLLSNQGVDIQLKWPNDLLVSTSEGVSKLGGVLVEVRGDTSGPCQVVIGVGVNIRLSEQGQAGIGQSIATLSELAPHVSRNVLVSAMIEAHIKMLERFEQTGFAAWRDRWNAYHVYQGRAVRIYQGNTVSEGVAKGVDDTGNLMVSIGGEDKRFAGGEVSLRGGS